MKVIAAYCFFFACGTGFVGFWGERRGCLALLWSQGGICLFFAARFYPFDLVQANSDYVGTRMYYAVWLSWVVSVLAVGVTLWLDGLQQRRTRDSKKG